MSGPKANYVKPEKPKLQIPRIVVPKIIKWPNEINFDMENIFSNMNLFKIMIKWRLHLIIIIAAAVGLSTLFSCSWFIKPKYKSTAVLYPSNLIPYSSETPTELMLQIFRSDDIRDSLISKFDLTEHYDVDKNDKYYYTKVIKEFESNVDVRKTEYESVVIDILDNEPEVACKMVKEMVNLFNKKARKMQRDKSLEILKIDETQLAQKQIQIDTLGKKLDTLRVHYGILDYTVQTKESMKAYYKMLGGSGKGNMNSVTGTIENLKTKGGDFILLSDLFYAATASYNKLKEDYENALKDVTKELTYTNYVSSPIPADKKTYPIRWLIVVITTLATFIFSMIVIMLLENAKRKEDEKISKAEGA
jgi:capsular polysaccharide biosynthesis protein